MIRAAFASLHVRLILLVLLAIIPALGMALYTASRQWQLAEANIQENEMRLARFVARGQEQLMDHTHQLLGGLAQVREVRSGDAAACSTLFANLLQRYPSYINLGAADPDGNIFCSALPFAGSVNIADRSFFRQALTMKDFAIGDYQLGRITGKATVASGYPVLDDRGAIQAVVFAALDLAWINQFIAKAQLPEGAVLLMLDHMGTILAHYPALEGWVGQSLPEAPLVQAILRRQGEGTIEAPGIDGVSRLYAFIPMRRVSGRGEVYVSIGIPTAVAFAEVHQVLTHTLVGLGFLTILVLLVTRVFGNICILRQVKALVKATRQMAAGDLSARSGLPHGQGELSQLAATFDEMAQTLQIQQAEVKQTEATLRRQTQELAFANTELTRSNKDLDDFAYIASHDLKEPLRGLHNYATFLLEDYHDALDDEGRSKLATLVRLTQRMEAIINSLLYYSRIDRTNMVYKDTDLNMIITEVLESLAIPLQEAGIAIRLPTLLPFLRCDKVRVSEIFANLITNAMKYNDKAEKWIEIGVIADQAQGHPRRYDGDSTSRPQATRIFYVRDNGIGIPEKHHEAIFRIFKRLHARDKYGGGTGVGLTIVKKMVERHGGDIWVESLSGAGSTFYFTLEEKHE